MTRIDLSGALSELISRFPRRRVLVVGDAMLDEYLLGDCSRISPEAPVPVLKVTSTRHVPGGAANTAANIVSLGGQATLVAEVGNDEGGRILTRCAADAGVDLLAIDRGSSTLRKTRVVSRQQQIVRLDHEDDRPAGAAVDAGIAALVDGSVDAHDVVVISDYAKGVVSMALAKRIIARAHAAGRPVVVDPRPQNRECYRGCDYLTPNWRESRALLGLGDAEPTAESVAQVARRLAAELGTSVVLTLGPHGIAFCSSTGAEQFALPTDARDVFDVSGAGDTVAAAFALALAAGADHHTAVALANRAAGIAVGKFGTATVTADEILRETEVHRLVPRQQLASLADGLRARGKRIVTVNGAFDILHAGHLHILNEARRRGDVVIVAINSDRSVRASKGAGRPVVPERRRAEMLLALRQVDYVHIFDEADPIALVREIRPDVHVNGSEYGEGCLETDAVLVDPLESAAAGEAVARPVW